MEMTTRMQPDEAARARTIEESAAWDARLRDPDCTEGDRARFAAWRDADPAHRISFERLQLIQATFRRDRGRAEMRALRNEAFRVIDARRRRRIAWGVASVSILAVVMTLWRTSSGEWLREPIAALVARLSGGEIYATGIGQRSTFVLQDGSSVELDADSKIEVAFTASERNVELLEGRAMFEVAKNSLRPFIVHAANRKIVAVGTQFDVRLDKRSVQVTLVEGEVRVTRSSSAPLRNTDDGVAADASAIVLTPGKQLIAQLRDPLSSQLSRGRQAQIGATSNGSRPRELSLAEAADLHDAVAADVVRDIDVAKVTGWRDGRVFFEDLSLADAIAQMNKYSTTQIHISDAALGSLRVNGMFMAGSQQAFATALESYFPLIAERRGEKEIVLIARR
jgi:transmembrane sensor